MQRKNIFALLLVAIFVFVQAASIASAQADENSDIRFFGLELEKLLTFVNALIATFLFVVAFIAYKRDQRRRLFYVSLAFLLFAIKSFLISSELILPDVGWVDPVA